MSKKTKNRTLAVFVASICLFALTPSLGVAAGKGLVSRWKNHKYKNFHQLISTFQKQYKDN